MATKKKCAECDKTGKTVKASVDNTTGARVGSRRCKCKAHR
jgi:hypothetical protein